jgi:sugar/nucleoside kinase (ribokinase family)
MKRESPKERIAVIGELNVDIVATGLASPPRMGSEIIAESIQTTLGSASAIFACGISKLGRTVTFISKVGADGFGDFCLEALEKAGVATDHVMLDKKAQTGITISLSAHKDRALVTYLGAISLLTYDQLSLSAIENHRHLHMTSYFLQSGLRPSFPGILKEARRMGLSTSFDPNSDPSQEWEDEIWQVVAQTDVLFLNETEALQLTGATRARAALKSLSKHTPCAVIKLGSKGAMAIREGKIARVHGFKVKALDTTGAGDSFAAGFISAYIEGSSLADCLKTGNACGALSTLKAGGTGGQPDQRALKKFLRQNR